jgi:hypothetical protein
LVCYNPAAAWSPKKNFLKRVILASGLFHPDSDSFKLRPQWYKC